MSIQTHTIQYGPPGRYYVRRESDRKPVAHFESKSDAIAESEKLNGWPVTGSEMDYATSRRESRRTRGSHTQNQQ